MAFTSGIRASGSGSEYTKKIVLKDSATYGPWRTKLTAILDAEDSLEIVMIVNTQECLVKTSRMPRKYEASVY